MSLLYSQTATASVDAGTKTITVSGMDLNPVLPGMVINLGARDRVRGDGLIIASVAATGSSGGTITTVGNVDTAFSSSPFVIDTRDFNGSASNYALAAFAQVLNALMKLTSPLTTLFGGSRVLALDKDSAPAISRLMFAVAGRLWSAIEHRTLAGRETLSIRSYPDGTTPVESITIDLPTGGVDALSNIWGMTAATTVDLGSVPHRIVYMSGSATISSFGRAPKRHRDIVFLNDGSTLVHSASIQLPSGLNISVSSGDRAQAYCDDSGNWIVTHYTRADGSPVVSRARNNSYITGPAGSDRVQRWQTNGVDRWSVYATAAAEGGANTGSDFAIARYADAGGFLDVPMSINRASGVVSFTKRPLFDGGPAFVAGLPANQSVSNGAQFLTAGALYNRGNAYNSSNYAFTATIAGVYHFDLIVTILGGAASIGQCGLALRVNGNDYTQTFDSKARDYNNLALSAIIALSPGDYVQPIVFLDSMQGTPVAQAGRSLFSGHFVS
jgi:hypothetical protein